MNPSEHLPPVTRITIGDMIFPALVLLTTYTMVPVACDVLTISSFVRFNEMAETIDNLTLVIEEASLKNIVENQKQAIENLTRVVEEASLKNIVAEQKQLIKDQKLQLENQTELIEEQRAAIQNLTKRHDELQAIVGENQNNIVQLNVSEGQYQSNVIENLTREQALLKMSIAEMNASVGILKSGKI